MKKKVEEQLNLMLKFARETNLNEEQQNEIGKIGFLYSIGRMSPLEVALRLWYVINKNVDGIYEKSFQNFIDKTCRQ